MLLVDSSVWIQYFNKVVSAETDHLDHLLENETLVIGDLILTEVLQGIRHQQQFDKIHRIFSGFPIVTIGGRDIAVQVSQNYRYLRNKGITVRKTIDCLIATYCIQNQHTLLHADRDFHWFEQHLGLNAWHS